LLYASAPGCSGKKRKISFRAKDPEFLKIVYRLVDEVQIEGGHRKPVWEDALIVRIVLLPKYIHQWATLQYKLKYKQEQLTRDDKARLVTMKVGLNMWETLTEEEREECIGMQVWQSEKYEAWLKDREDNTLKAKRPGLHKRTVRSTKKSENGSE
jgi:hypothetical protein